MSGKNTKKIVISIIVILVLIGATAFAVMSLQKSKKKGSAGFGGGNWGGAGGQATATSVKTVKAEKTILKDFVLTNGEVETQNSIEVFPSIGGEVVQVNVSLGSPVRKGDVIAYIDPSTPGSYYAKSPVVAPISGSILVSPAKLGAKVSTASVITKIGDIENLQISAKIPERYVADLQIGQKAEITLEAYPDVIFMASVVRISPVLDAASRTKEVILNFDKKDSRLNAGMFAKVKLYTKEYSKYFAVKQDALVSNREDNFLYVVNEDGETVTKRKVKLGKNVGGYYQITEGVNIGETVVVAGMLTLYEGAKVIDITNGVKEPSVKKDAPENKQWPGAPGEKPDFGKDGGKSKDKEGNSKK